MELPKASKGNQYVVVFQGFLSKWPFVFTTKDQKATTLAKLLVEEVIGVPEALLSDRGTNLLSHLMRDVCELFGVAKTTACHPQCNGLIERFNRTLKMMRKHLGCSGTGFCQECCGLTETRHMIQQGKNHLFSYSG